MTNKARFNKLPQLEKLKTVKAEEKESGYGHAEGCGEDLCTAPPSQESEDL